MNYKDQKGKYGGLTKAVTKRWDGGSNENLSLAIRAPAEMWIEPISFVA
jgi:hypothetical protein